MITFQISSWTIPAPTAPTHLNSPLVPRPPTPHFPTSVPTTSAIHLAALTMKPMRHFLHAWTGHWLHSSQQNGGSDRTFFKNLSAIAACVRVYLMFAQGPGDFIVGVCVSACLAGYGQGIADVCFRRRKKKSAKPPLSVAVGSNCTSHTHTSACIISLDECDILPARLHEPLPVTPRGAACRKLRSKPTRCLSSLVRHQRHSHSRTAFYKPFINPAQFLGDWNYSVSSLLSHNSRELIINGPVKQCTACCILIQ